MTEYFYEFYESRQQWACIMAVCGQAVDCGFGATKEDAKAELDMRHVVA